MCPIAVAEIVIISIYFILPLRCRGGHPVQDDEFTWKFVNYAPIVTGGALLAARICWHLSAKKWFTGPKHTIDPEVVRTFDT